MGCCGSELDNLIEHAYEVMGKSYEKGAKLTTKQRKKLKKSQFCQI